MEFNKREFWSTMIILLLVFVGTWVLGAIFHPIFIACALSVLIIVWKSKTIWTGIKHYWNLLMNVIFKNKVKP